MFYVLTDRFFIQPYSAHKIATYPEMFPSALGFAELFVQPYGTFSLFPQNDAAIFHTAFSDDILGTKLCGTYIPTLHVIDSGNLP